jgi:tricorn protease
MSKFIFLFTLLWGQNLFTLQPSLLWIQQPALSLEGQRVAFEFKGNLYKVSFAGGKAIALTTNRTYNGYPVWRYEGKEVALASDRFGSFDVFTRPVKRFSSCCKQFERPRLGSWKSKREKTKRLPQTCGACS